MGSCGGAGLRCHLPALQHAQRERPAGHRQPLRRERLEGVQELAVQLELPAQPGSPPQPPVEPEYHIQANAPKTRRNSLVRFVHRQRGHALQTVPAAGYYTNAGEVDMPEYPVAQAAGHTPGTVSGAALIEEAGLERDGDYGRLEGLVVARK